MNTRERLVAVHAPGPDRVLPPSMSRSALEDAEDVPVVVDLDGTLVHTDLLHESALQLLRTAPVQALRIPLWLLHGKAWMKQQLAQRMAFDPAALPYNLELLDWLREQQAAGRTLVLCTAADQAIAQAVARHLGIFERVLASDGHANLEGARKAQALVEEFGPGGFDYAGNAAADLPVWEQARRAIVVSASRSVAQRAAATATVERVFDRRLPGPGTWMQVLRLHHWLKNVLLFVPLLAAHQLFNPAAWASLMGAFAAFGWCASAVYIANDLMDLESDRQHPRKRRRPFASGAVQPWVGVVLVPLLVVSSLVLARQVNAAFFSWLLAYLALTSAYTWWLKRVILLDCLTLAALYTLRVVAGSYAAGLSLSIWLLAFCGFLFLSLAYVKRYAELRTQAAAGRTHVHGRAYLTTDAPLVQALGVAAGYTAVVVLGMYLNSDAVGVLYAAPELAWGVVPVMVYWVSWLWLRASRGEMHDDPLVFAFKDKASLAAGVAFGAALLAGTLGWP